MSGLQNWHLIILANIVIVAGLIFLTYWYFVGSRKRARRKQQEQASRNGDSLE